MAYLLLSPITLDLESASQFHLIATLLTNVDSEWPTLGEGSRYSAQYCTTQSENGILGALADTMQSVGQQAACPRQLPTTEAFHVCNELEGLLTLNVREEEAKSLLGKHLAQRSELKQLPPKRLAFLAWSQRRVKPRLPFQQGPLTITSLTPLLFVGSFFPPFCVLEDDK